MIFLTLILKACGIKYIVFQNVLYLIMSVCWIFCSVMEFREMRFVFFFAMNDPLIGKLVSGELSLPQFVAYKFNSKTRATAHWMF